MKNNIKKCSNNIYELLCFRRIAGKKKLKQIYDSMVNDKALKQKQFLQVCLLVTGLFTVCCIFSVVGWFFSL